MIDHHVSQNDMRSRNDFLLSLVPPPRRGELSSVIIPDMPPITKIKIRTRLKKKGETNLVFGGRATSPVSRDQLWKYYAKHGCTHTSLLCVWHESCERERMLKVKLCVVPPSTCADSPESGALSKERPTCSS